MAELITLNAKMTVACPLDGDACSSVNHEFNIEVTVTSPILVEDERNVRTELMENLRKAVEAFMDRHQ